MKGKRVETGVFNRQIIRQEQLTVKRSKVKTKAAHCGSDKHKQEERPDKRLRSIVPKESTRLTTITRFDVIDKLFTRLILPPKRFVIPIHPHFLLYIWFCMCLICPTKRTTPAQAQQCRFAFPPVCFDGIKKKARFTVVLFAGFFFFFYYLYLFLETEPCCCTHHLVQI